MIDQSLQFHIEPQIEEGFLGRFLAGVEEKEVKTYKFWISRGEDDEKSVNFCL